MHIFYTKNTKNKGRKLTQRFQEKILLMHTHDSRYSVMTSGVSYKHGCLNGMPHSIFVHPERKHKDCTVCSDRKISVGKKETRFFS